MSKFYFFTDPSVLDAQTAAQAFGPAGTAAGKDQFRVTDIHTSTASTDVPAFAVCDGLVCAQADDQGTLTLILKPSVQPPFDFPAISYILYKGIEPSSLLAADGEIDVTQEADSDLISAIKTAWELEANANTGSPTRDCIGLHLNPADYPDDDNPQRFADAEPLDRLFYEGDPVIQLPLVRGGGRLGTFSASLPFGIEIVVERIGRRPKITVTRKVENLIEVDTLATTPTSSEVFLHWDKKEATLDFVDPCAFWGSFFAAKLRAWNSADDDFEKLSGNEVYETVLRGTVPNAAKFANRNRAYLDLRNEHGNSLNYYQADGPNIQLTLDPDADIDASEVNYYASGWPSFFVDNTSLPAGTTGDKIDVRFALPKTANTRPLIYISAGYRDKFRRLKDGDRFLDRPRRADVSYLAEASITLPLVDDGGTKLISMYQRIFLFKRPLIANGAAVSTVGPGNLAPSYTELLDQVFQVLRTEDFHLERETTLARTYAEERYITSPTATYAGFAARLTVAEDALNRYWLFTPYRYYRWPWASVFDGGSGLPGTTISGVDNFLADYIERRSRREILQLSVSPPSTASSQSSVEIAVEGEPRISWRGFSGASFDRTVILCLAKSDIAQLLAGLATENPVPGSAFLLPGPPELFERSTRRYIRSSLALTYLKTSPSVAREVVATSLEIYSHATV